MTIRLNPCFWAAQVFVVAVAVFGGCQWQGNRDEQARANLNHEIAWLENDVATLSVEAAEQAGIHVVPAVNDQAVTK